MAKKKKSSPSSSTNAPSKKSTIAEIFKRNADAVKSVKGREFLEIVEMDSSSMTKRINAVLAHMDRAAEEFQPKYTEIASIPEKLADYEALPFKTFNEVNDSFNVYLAAALWILDELKRTSKIHKAYKYLPQDMDLLFRADMPWDFYDASYDGDLIRSVIVVLAGRNGGDDLTRLVTKKGKQSGWREQYEAIIGLLDADRVQQACERFREKQWDFLDRYFKCANSYVKRENQILREIETMERQRNSQLNNSPLLMKPSGLLPGLGASGTAGTNTVDDLKRLAMLEMQLHSARETIRDFDINASDYCDMSYEEALADTKNRTVAETMPAFRIGNPFEICFAFLYLLDRDDESAWLHNTSIAVVNIAGAALPWSVDELEDEFDDEQTFNGTHWLEGDNSDPIDFYNTWFNGEDIGMDDCGRINPAQLIYKLCKGVAPRGMHPFHEIRQKMKGGDPDLERVIDTAEILFLSAFQSKSASYDASLNLPFEGLFNDEESDSVEDGGEVQTVKAPLGGYWGSVAGKLGMGEVSVSRTSIVEPVEDESVDYEAENKRLQNEINQLKKALYESGRANRHEKQKLEHEREIAELEHRELADLRELVFNQQEGIYEAEETVEQITFPCSTQHRIVVFGGHDSWAREIKPKLPDVRFIDREALPNADMIRKADVVWIQPNSLAHKHFYKIIDEVRKHSIPVRYFTYSSAAKCAEQLVLEDRK